MDIVSGNLKSILYMLTFVSCGIYILYHIVRLVILTIHQKYAKNLIEKGKVIKSCRNCTHLHDLRIKPNSRYKCFLLDQLIEKPSHNICDGYCLHCEKAFDEYLDLCEVERLEKEKREAEKNREQYPIRQIERDE